MGEKKMAASRGLDTGAAFQAASENAHTLTGVDNVTDEWNGKGWEGNERDWDTSDTWWQDDKAWSDSKDEQWRANDKWWEANGGRSREPVVDSGGGKSVNEQLIGAGGSQRTSLGAPERGP